MDIIDVKYDSVQTKTYFLETNLLHNPFVYLYLKPNNSIED